jgi:nucleoside-diphosphate-sugar epimerase
MATLVTGGTGFVASNVVRTLAERGHEVVCFDLVAPHALLREYIKPWADRITFVQGDILQQEDLNQLLSRDITKIVHAAVFTGVLPEVEVSRSRSIVDINVMGTTNLLELARRLRVERFLYVSSGSIYGEDHDPKATLVEDTAPRPRTLYALTKYASELLTRRYGELHGFPTVSTRLGSPFGPMERVTDHRANQSVLKGWTGNVVRGEPVEVADRTVEATFTYVADIANGIATVLDAPALSYDVYNVAGEERRSMGYVLQVLEEVHPGLRVVDVPSTVPIRGGSPLSAARLRSDLGFVPRFDLRSGVREYVAWRQASGFTE